MIKNDQQYIAIDEYAIAELEYEYLCSDRNGKIEILSKVYNSDAKYQIPYELAKLFIEEADDYAYCLINKCYRGKSKFCKRCIIKDVTEAG